MEDITIPSTQDVNTEETSNEEVKEEETQESFEVSKEEYAKLQDLERNKAIALKQEREERKAIAQKLAEYEEKERIAREEEMLKEWKYKELIDEKDKLINDLKSKETEFNDYLETQKQKEKDELHELMLKVPAEFIEENKDLLAELSDKWKIKFIKNILKGVWKPSFDSEVWNGDKAPNDKSHLAKQEAKWKWFDAFLNTMLKSNI